VPARSGADTQVRLYQWFEVARQRGAGLDATVQEDECDYLFRQERVLR
jgi:hypothetical protein